MKRILIIGAGFAGLSAAAVVCRRRENEVVLIDRRATQQSLPLLPDIIGRALPPQALCLDIARWSLRIGCRFLLGQIEEIALEKREAVTADSKRLSFDTLLIAGGAVPTFYGRDDLAKSAFTFNSVEAVCSLAQALDKPHIKTAVVSGGGYTGIELATNIKRRWSRQGRKGEVIIVERAAALLGTLPEGLREYAVENVRRMGIIVKTGVEVKTLQGETITLSDATMVAPGVLAWTAGMETPGFVRRLKLPQDRQGRLVVDQYLRCSETCFAAGDSAHVNPEQTTESSSRKVERVDTPAGGVIRMGVQFAVAQGVLAGYNILASLSRKPLRAYNPRDLGYIVPMANNHSCGVVLGATLYGRFPTLFHYLMCIYRSSSIRNMLAVTRGVLARRSP